MQTGEKTKQNKKQKQLIKTITKFEKETRHQMYVFILEKNNNKRKKKH